MASKPKRKAVSVTSVPYGAGGGGEDLVLCIVKELAHSVASKTDLMAHLYSLSDHTVSVLHEGWCTKESGSSFLGKTNWRKRWFRLAQKRRDVLLEYYK